MDASVVGVAAHRWRGSGRPPRKFNEWTTLGFNYYPPYANWTALGRPLRDWPPFNRPRGGSEGGGDGGGGGGGGGVESG